MTIAVDMGRKAAKTNKQANKQTNYHYFVYASSEGSGETVRLFKHACVAI